MNWVTGFVSIIRIIVPAWSWVTWVFVAFVITVIFLI